MIISTFFMDIEALIEVVCVKMSNYLILHLPMSKNLDIVIVVKL